MPNVTPPEPPDGWSDTYCTCWCGWEAKFPMGPVVDDWWQSLGERLLTDHFIACHVTVSHGGEVRPLSD